MYNEFEQTSPANSNGSSRTETNSMVNQVFNGIVIQRTNGSEQTFFGASDNETNFSILAIDDIQRSPTTNETFNATTNKRVQLRVRQRHHLHALG